MKRSNDVVQKIFIEFFLPLQLTVKKITHNHSYFNRSQTIQQTQLTREVKFFVG